MILAAGIALALIIVVMGLAAISREWSIFRMATGLAAFIAVVLVAMVGLTP